jgi:hypothetical protein
MMASSTRRRHASPDGRNIAALRQPGDGGLGLRDTALNVIDADGFIRIIATLLGDRGGFSCTDGGTRVT